jgi:hypothetical protein
MEAVQLLLFESKPPAFPPAFQEQRKVVPPAHHLTHQIPHRFVEVEGRWQRLNMLKFLSLTLNRRLRLVGIRCQTLVPFLWVTIGWKGFDVVSWIRAREWLSHQHSPPACPPFLRQFQRVKLVLFNQSQRIQPSWIFLHILPEQLLDILRRKRFFCKKRRKQYRLFLKSFFSILTPLANNLIDIRFQKGPDGGIV